MEKRGLNSQQAKNLLDKYGPNELREINKKGPLIILLHQIKGNFITYLLFIAMVLSFFVGKNITAYTILVVILLVTITGFFQEYKAEKVISSLKDMIVPVSIVIRDGREMEIETTKLVPGDIILLRNGEKIPADSIILEQKELLVNESILTGESKEVSKKIIKNEKDYSEENMLYMGSFIVNGKCIAKVIHTGMNTKFGKIAKMISHAEKKLPLQDKINSISKYMILVAISFSLFTGALMFFNQPYSTQLLIESLTLVIALAVSAFPEGLPVVLTTALSRGAYVMAKKNAIVNRMSIIETLGETTVICSDKTGTITKGEMTVKKILTDGRIYEVSGTGYEGNGDFIFNNKKISPEKEKVLSRLIEAGVACNDANISRTGEDKNFNIIGNPTEAALLVMASKAGIYQEDLQYSRIEEIPFNSERKRMSVLVKNKEKRLIYSKGAPEFVLSQCKYVQRKEGIFRITEKERKNILLLNEDMTSETLRTLALAYKEPNKGKKIEESDFIFLGLVGIEDPPKEEVKEAIQICKNAGIEVKMITGDNRETAKAIAKQIGIQGKIMDGNELEKISEEELSKIVKEIVIFARVKPEHKLKIVKALKMNGEIVTMTGDGVNDAPALKEAHIGVAMGIAGTDVSREVADLTLKDDNFATIVEAIKEGRTIFKNIRKFIGYQLSCNYAELAILFFGVLLAPFFGWHIPLLLALQILFMNLVTDDIPAISLALTPSSEDIMLEKPIKNQKIMNKAHWGWTITAGALMAIMTLGVYYVVFNIVGQTIIDARTTALLTLIFLEIGGAYNFLSFRREVTPKSAFANKYLFGASIISIIATIVIIYSPLNKIFETVPVGRLDWIFALLFALILIIIFNILKRINNKKGFLKLN